MLDLTRSFNILVFFILQLFTDPVRIFVSKSILESLD